MRRLAHVSVRVPRTKQRQRESGPSARQLRVNLDAATKAQALSRRRARRGGGESARPPGAAAFLARPDCAKSRAAPPPPRRAAAAPASARASGHVGEIARFARARAGRASRAASPHPSARQGAALRARPLPRRARVTRGQAAANMGRSCGNKQGATPPREAGQGARARAGLLPNAPAAAKKSHLDACHHRRALRSPCSARQGGRPGAQAPRKPSLGRPAEAPTARRCLARPPSLDVVSAKACRTTTQSATATRSLCARSTRSSDFGLRAVCGVASARWRAFAPRWPRAC